MNKLKNFAKKDKQLYLSAIIFFVLVCLVIGSACFQYYHRLQDTIKTEGSGYIQEISKQMATNVSKTINDNFSVLGTIAIAIENSNVNTYDQLQNIVQEQQNLWKYQKIMLIDSDGIAHDDQGKTITLKNDQYLLDAIVGQQQSLSASQVIDGKDCVVFAIPLQHMTIGTTKISALAASYDLSTFDKILAMTAFNGKGYAHIIRKDGTVVIRSSSPNALQTGYNILNSIADANIDNQSHLEIVKANIANGKSGQTEFTLNDIQEYMIYTPLDTMDWSLLTFVPTAVVVNAKANMLLKITLLLCSLITIGFSLLFACLMITFYRNKRKLERIAYIDPITGGNTIQKFYEITHVLLQSAGAIQYAMVYTNIEKFKVLNEQFGRHACNQILRSMEYSIHANLANDECMGRLSADNFCVLVKYTDESTMAARFDIWHQNCVNYMEQNESAWLPLIIEFGVYIIVNDSIPLPHMIDRAKLSLAETTRELHGKLRYAIYDEKIRQILFREKQLEDMMEDSLKNNEFQVYLQPKIHTQSEKIGGAEALVRWQTAMEGMIYPDEFIPLFEKNGFIVQLDLWVFEEVCKTISKWISQGLQPVPISVNCSRIHLKTPYFLNHYCAITDKYRTPRSYIEIELTENTVFENVEHLSKIINQIHDAGFGCSMDDFGSGYSSLNLIQDIPVDTIKLDRIFFRSWNRDLQRTESVVGSIITMSKALSMKTVAEGVEEREHVEMLKRLQCDYIQGYYFAKPMPIQQFEKLVFAEKD